MKRIGILTFHRANNYGAVLQNYALLKAIETLGYFAETIDYIIPDMDEGYRPKLFYKRKNPLRMLMANYNNLLNKRNELEQYKKYADFRGKYLKISSVSYSNTTIADSDYDLYIAGSDQIWNRGIVGDEHKPAFCLSFTNKKKASYAASCGGLDCSFNLEEIKDFDYITVREQDLCEHLNNKGLQAKVACDPTLLLSKDEWNDLIADVSIDHSDYVYLYYLDSGRDEAAKIAKDAASKLGDKVYYSLKSDRRSRKYGINRLSDGPLDFLKEIANSDFVVVSSFHGTVFSILFEKEFVAILHEKTGSRVKSLLSKLSLEDRIVKDYDDYKSREFSPIDYNRVNKTLEQWRQESLEELKKICEL